MMEAVTEEQEAEVDTANGKLNLYKEVSHRLIGLQEQLNDVEVEIKDIKGEMKGAKENRDAIIGSINTRLNDLRDIENGCYQRSLFAASQKKNAGPVDPAFECGIDCLGMSEKENELLESADIKMISDLEKQMRENKWWHREIKGFGQAKVDKLTDALLDWRLRNPVPQADDDELDGEPVDEAESESNESSQEDQTEEETDSNDFEEGDVVDDEFESEENPFT